LLNCLLTSWVQWINPRSVGTQSHHWTLNSNDSKDFREQYLQEFYYYKDSSPPDSFSSLDHLPEINQVPPEDYYSQRFVSTGDALIYHLILLSYWINFLLSMIICRIDFSLLAIG